MKTLSTASLLAAVFFLSACTATTSFQSEQSNVSVKVNDGQPLPADGSGSHSYPTTSFGNYRFMATKEDMDPMYGVMPLHFNNGYLVADILFFAPALFFNLREVFPYYQFDMEENVIRYKKNEDDAWTSYQPTTTEVEGAKNYFEGQGLNVH